MDIAQKSRTRLRALLLQKDERITVDREGNGAIRGISVITTGPALGHGFDIDAEMVESVAAALNGRPGRWTHGNLCEDGLGRHLGKWSNARVEASEDGARVLADFAFSASAHKIQPDGLTVSAPEYLMDRAEEDPSSLGISIVGDLELSESDGSTVAKLEAPEDLKRADWVGDPAANPTGLSLPGSELAEEATEHLNDIVSRFGREKTLGFLSAGLEVEILEQADAALERAKVEALAEELTAAKAEILELKAQLTAKREAEVEAYLETVRARTSNLQDPVTADELAQVRRLFDAGQDELAREVGEVFVSRSELAAQKPFKRPTTTTLEPPQADAKAKALAAEIRLLEGGGLRVELNADKTKIIRAYRPEG